MDAGRIVDHFESTELDARDGERELSHLGMGQACDDYRGRSRSFDGAALRDRALNDLGMLDRRGLPYRVGQVLIKPRVVSDELPDIKMVFGETTRGFCILRVLAA